ncbi:iron-containing alcohol dehydrogenase [Pelagibacterales bacterium]|nr:iron-containing alcohol dehydrogenase [Pelagibacterales bacterium]MDA7763703.1 iron-containing alcohol dehydrogenase [Pelagibacterales bacterium]
MLEINNTNWNYPTPIWFGLNRTAEIKLALKELSISRPLIVTDPQFSENENFKKMIEHLSKDSIQFSIFTDIKGNPTGKNVSDGVLKFNADANDGVIAIGGGSALDAGKAIAFMSKQKENLWFFEDVGDNWTKAIIKDMPKVIAIPTTAGTGSETGRASLIVDEDTYTKKIIFHPSILPDLVILDPELTISLPAHLTAATGMDALAHCLEAYCSEVYHPMAHGIAIEGVRIIKNNLVDAFKDPENLFARSQMLVSSPMGSTAFQKGLGAIHSLSHPINAIHDLHHGLTNAIFMPYVIKFNQSVIEEKMERLSKYIELKNQSFDGFLEWILDLRKQLSIPHTLKELNIKFDFDKLSKMALVDPSTPTNPIVLSQEDMKVLYLNSYEGNL